jgi:Protein of unknown function (DUF2384)
MPALMEETLLHPDAGRILTTAVLRAAEKLGVPASALAEVLGLSAASVSRMKSGDYRLNPRKKEFELGVLFVRLFRSLDAIVGGEERVARAWLANQNTALGGTPAEKIRSVSGLNDVIAYLDARRAIV